MKKQKKQPQLESQNLILYPLLPEQMNLLRDDPNELCRSLSLVPDDYATSHHAGKPNVSFFGIPGRWCASLLN